MNLLALDWKDDLKDDYQSILKTPRVQTPIEGSALVQVQPDMGM